MQNVTRVTRGIRKSSTLMFPTKFKSKAIHLIYYVQFLIIMYIKLSSRHFNVFWRKREIESKEMDLIKIIISS